jgi:murein DD-endopeptidase MepM/ murein hydrolase activator NlpD
MRGNLNEQLYRIHRLIYGKGVLKEQPKPDKADLVSTEVRDFYNTLENIETPLFQQKYGSMTYKKEVETIQIALILLGYPLPKFGVDGLFGPETADAVKKFKQDNNIKDDIEETDLINEAQKLIPPIPIQGVTSKFATVRTTGKHPGVDLKAKTGTPIKSPADGKVIDARFKEGACGGTIQVQHGGGFTSRYCHASAINVSIGQTVKQGDVLGLSGGGANDKGRGRSTGPHLHFELKKDGALVDPMDYIDKEIGSYNLSSTTTVGTKAVINDNMIELLISKLKEKNITSEDIKPYIFQQSQDTSGLFTNLDLGTQEGYDTYRKIVDEFIKTRSSNFLGINGKMIADGALYAYKNFQNTYVPPELALAQLTQEGGFSSNKNALPIRTKNPYNIGNWDRGSKTTYMPSLQDGINQYFKYVSNDYLIRGKKTPSDLLKSYVNKNNKRYASDVNYETQLKKIVGQVNRVADIVTSGMKKTNNQV